MMLSILLLRWIVSKLVKVRASRTHSEPSPLDKVSSGRTKHASIELTLNVLDLVDDTHGEKMCFL